MSAEAPTNIEKEKLQKFYLAARNLLQDRIIPEICVQRSFEEAIAGFQGADTWRPTHISRSAVAEIVTGTYKNVQRAHGVVGKRLDRYDRTLTVLKGEMMEFDAWWEFWQEHDATVLITKSEHASDRKFEFDELVELPDKTLGMFVNSGFSFKIRKKVEMKWLQEIYEKLSSC